MKKVQKQHVFLQSNAICKETCCRVWNIETNDFSEVYKNGIFEERGIKQLKICFCHIIMFWFMSHLYFIAVNFKMY